jgi:cell wall-associated NlpC family hydrolase
MTLTAAITGGYDATISAVLRAGFLVLLLAGVSACAAKGGTPRPFPNAPVPPGAAPPPPSGPASAPSIDESPALNLLLETALSYRGVPYRYGGSDPTGFDCSGFVQWVFAQHGLALPREVRDQYQLGTKIDRDEVEPGDLVFFDTESHGASHVGIALGGDSFVHAPSSRGVVRVESYSSDYWKRRWVGARRVD